jgi:hypothetical protein
MKVKSVTSTVSTYLNMSICLSKTVYKMHSVTEGITVVSQFVPYMLNIICRVSYIK